MAPITVGSFFLYPPVLPKEITDTIGSAEPPALFSACPWRQKNGKGGQGGVSLLVTPRWKCGYPHPLITCFTDGMLIWS